MEAKLPYWALSILYWLSWLFCGLLLVVNILEIREASLAVITTIHVQRTTNIEGEGNSTQFDSTLHTIDILMFYLAAMLGISLAILVEYYFRFGLKQGKLFQRIGKVLGIQVVFLVACVIVQAMASTFFPSAP